MTAEKINKDSQSPSKTLKELLDFEVPLANKEAYEKLFDEIADAYLNHTLLVLKHSGSTKKSYFRVAEIEFYFNDNQVHKDTFTHGDDM